VLLRALTYNIHKCIGGVDGKYHPERVCSVIAHYEPDVVFLQEVDHGAKRSKGDRQIDVIGERLGLRHRAFVANVKVRGGGEYGNGILSRYPLTDVSNIDLTLPPKKRRSALHARCRVRLGDATRTVHLFGMHLGLSGFERKLQLRAFLGSPEVTRLHENTPTIVAGDLNDVWGTLGPKVLAPAGFRGSGRLRSFPSFAPLRALDGIHVRGDIAFVDARTSRLELARVASDHLPVIAELVLTA
jgi:endonuclease/exonuclease/phosphatase family metal-dependent hydrolase